MQEHHGGCHFRIASPSPCLLLGSADWLQCEGYNWEVQAKKAHAVASSFEAPLLELNAQVIILISSCTVIPYTPFLQLNKLWCLFYDLHTLKSMQPHVSLLLQTFQITWTIWHSLPTNCRDLCKPSYNPFYVHSVALIPFAKKKHDCGGSEAMSSCSPRSWSCWSRKKAAERCTNRMVLTWWWRTTHLWALTNVFYTPVPTGFKAFHTIVLNK